VVVAVVAMRMMQVPIYEVVDVIAMRHGFVAAIRPVPVVRLVAAGVMVWITAVRILPAHGDDMLMGAASLGVFKPAMVEIIDMAFMLHGDVPTAGAMDVRRSLVGTVLFGCHRRSFLPTPSSAGDYAGGRDVERSLTRLASGSGQSDLRRRFPQHPHKQPLPDGHHLERPRSQSTSPSRATFGCEGYLCLGFLKERLGMRLDIRISFRLPLLATS
jgi:hypothetical protein